MRTLTATLLAALLLPAGAAAETHEVAIPGNYYSPSQLVVLVGDTVTWTNHDAATHTVTSSGAFDSGFLAHDQSFSRTFDTEGSYRFVCTIHTYMQGEVDVYGIAFGPGGAIAPGQSPSLAPGQSVILKGQVPAGTEEVTIERRLADGSHAPVTTVLADAEGAFSVAVSPTLPTYYRAVAAGRASSDVLVSVGAVVRLRVSGWSGRAVLLEASTSPEQEGAVVVLERYVREQFAWKPVSRQLLGTPSRARFRYAPRQPVLVRVRLVEGVDGYGPAVSNERRIWPLPR
jgi:plastocyanin